MTFEQKLKEEREDAWEEGDEHGVKRGIELGREQGRNLERTETIASMIGNGFDDNQIMSVYKTIHSEEIAAIRQQMIQA